MNEKVCIVCPRGCMMSYQFQDDELIVTNNECRRGPEYLTQELTAPKRMLTTTIKVLEGVDEVIPVYAKEYVDKDQVFTIINHLKALTIKAPIHCNDVIIEQIGDIKVTILASKEVQAK